MSEAHGVLPGARAHETRVPGPREADGARAHEIRVVGDEAGLERCFAVREEVFIREQGVPEELEYDAYDARALHVLAIGAEGPLGTARLVHGAAAREKSGCPEGVGSLGRLAVTASARGLGLGAALVRAVEREARRLGLTTLELDAQVTAVGFYERLGYAAHGPRFLDAGIEHRAMRRRLSA